MKRIITILLVCLSFQMSAQCWQSISAGENHSLAVRTDGTLWAWGFNGTGQLGDNTVVDKNVPTQIGTASNWLKVCSGYSLSVAIKTDGTLWAWGRNDFGQIGLGTNTPTFYSVPTQVGTDTNWQNISVGVGFCLAIKNNGTIWAWGDNSYGQLGDNTLVDKYTPIQVGTESNWQTISAGGHHCLAIKTNGTLWAWGRNGGAIGDNTSTDRLSPIQIGTDTNWQSVDGGYFHSAAIKTNGTLWGWGANSSGQLGDGTTVRKYVPTQAGTATNWLSVSAGYSFTYATKTDYSLWSYGINDEGQLGNGTSGTATTITPTRIGLTLDTFTISAGYFHVLEKNSDGFLRACGQNTTGQIGDGTNVQKNSLTTISCTNLATNDFGIANELKAYPNPIKEILNLSFDKEISSVSIYNVLGQEVISKSINANQGTIDTATLASGTYIVKVASNNEVKTLKVIKE